MRNHEFATIGKLGVNFQSDPSELKDEELAYAQNVIPGKLGTLGTRPSMEHALLLNSVDVPATTGGAYYVVTVLDFIFSTCPGVLMAAVMVSRIYDYMADTTTDVRRLHVYDSSGREMSITVLGEYCDRPYLINIGDVTLCLNGTDSNIIRAVAGGFEVLPYIPLIIGTGSTKMMAPKLATSSYDRVILANLGTGMENWVLWGYRTGDLNANGEGGAAVYNFASNALGATQDGVSGLPIGLDTEGPITAAFGGANAPEGYPAQGAVFIFKRDFMYTMLGQPGKASDAQPEGNITVIKSQVRAGCVSQATMCSTPYGLVWAGPDNVWFMPWGNQPIPVGDKLRPWLLDQPAGMQWRWHAEYHGGIYRLAIFDLGQGPDVLSPCAAQFWLDFRAQVPEGPDTAIWYGPQKYVPAEGPAGTFTMRRGIVQSDNTNLYSLTYANLAGAVIGSFEAQTVLVTLNGVGSTDNAAVQMETRKWQPATAYAVGDIVVPSTAAGVAFRSYWTCSVAGTSHATTEPAWSGTGIGDNSVFWLATGSDEFPGYQLPSRRTANEIVPLIRTAESVKPSALYEKVVTSGYCTFDALQAFQLNYRLLPDFEDDVKVLELASTARLVGVDVLATTTRLGRSWTARQLPPNPSGRPRALSIQMQLQQAVGFVVDPQYTQGVVRVNSFAVTAVFDIPQGYWDDLNAWYGELAYNISIAIMAATGTISPPFSQGRNVYGVFYYSFDDALITGTFPCMDNGAYGTQAQRRVNRYIWETLGFDVVALSALSTGIGVLVYGQQTVRLTNPTPVVFKELSVRYRPFRRNPT